MRWPEDAKGWPMAQNSRVILVKPHRWHLQEAGSGDTLLLLHGAGGASQSWRSLFPLLTETHHVVCLDLPGQGFTRSGAQRRFGLCDTADDIAAMCKAEGIRPKAIIGHSAGAALALRMVQTGFKTDCVIGINAALGEFKGVAGWLFPALAKFLATTPITASIFNSTASPASLEKLLASTGSKIDATGRQLYLRLAQDRGHVDATLSMMAQWDLKPLLDGLQHIDVPVHFIAGSNDRTVPPDTSRSAAEALNDATFDMIEGFGHLLHEEAPEITAQVIRRYLQTKTPATKAGV